MPVMHLPMLIQHVRAADAAHEVAIRADPYSDEAEKAAWAVKQGARRTLNDAVYRIAGVNIDELKALTRT